MYGALWRRCRHWVTQIWKKIYAFRLRSIVSFTGHKQYERPMMLKVRVTGIFYLKLLTWQIFFIYNCSLIYLLPEKVA